MKHIAIIALLALGGCESAQRRASDKFVNCIYQVNTATDLKEDERHFLLHACRELYFPESDK